MGYPKETKGYYFYNRDDNKLFVARNGVILEKEFLSKNPSGSKVVLEEIETSNKWMWRTPRQRRGHMSQLI